MSSNGQKGFTKMPLHSIEVFFFASILERNELNLQVCLEHFATFLKGVAHAKKNWTKFISMLDNSEKPFVKGASVLEENELNSWACSST